MFLAALSTIAKTWKQPKRPLTDEWTKQIGVEVWESQYTTHLCCGIEKRLKSKAPPTSVVGGCLG